MKRKKNKSELDEMAKKAHDLRISYGTLQQKETLRKYWRKGYGKTFN